MTADLALFFGWSPLDAMLMTGTDLVWWHGQAMRLQGVRRG